MPNISEIKSRMLSIKETKKITDAMYMISSVKVRHAKREVENTKPYFDALKDEITDLLKYIPQTKSRYFHAPLPEGKEHFCHGILLVTSDKGLAGNYNNTAIKMTEKYIGRHPDTMLFIVGEYGRQYFKAKKIPYVSDFTYSAAFPTVWEAQKICVELLEYFNDGKLDEINIIYTGYKLRGLAECKRNVLLPLDKSSFKIEASDTIQHFKEFYPDVHTVLEGIIPSYLTGFIYSSLVDSYCSEQEARMTAMNTAGKNADEMLKKLQMQYNSIRQAAITNEMIEITSGAKALRAKRVKKSEKQ